MGVIGSARMVPAAAASGSGTVTSVSVASANGLAGTVATATTTPAITLSTTVTGLLKGNATTISAAVAGTDYLAPNGNGSALTGITVSQVSGAAPLASPALTGTPTAPTGTAGDSSTQIATDAFVTNAVNNAIAGVNPAVAGSAAPTAAGDTSAWTYNNGVSGVGATFTGPVNTAITIDGVLFNALTQSLLVKNDTQSPSGAFNGIYNLTALQTGITGAIFTRRLDYDTPSDMNNTGAIPVVSGTANATTSWLLTSNIVTVGTDPLTYAKFSSNPATLAPLASPTFTGTPAAPTATAGTNTTQIATTAYVEVAAGWSNNVVTVTSNAGTVPVTSRLSTVTNSSAATMAITIATASAVDGQPLTVRIYDFSGAAQTIGWTNTENSQVSVPLTSNGSTTSPLTVGFMFNAATSKWRCVAVA